MSYGISFTRVYNFSAAHRLHSAELSEKENIEVYDKCNNINGHGHDYTLEVSLSAEPDRQTGMIYPLPLFDRKVNRVLSELDHKHLDHEVAFFKTHLSTGEVIIQYLWQELEKQFPQEMLYHLKLWETANNYFELGREEY